ncbi:MAG TPA: SAM hydroxide adenosyltransferase [Limnochordales bacterium]
MCLSRRKLPLVVVLAAVLTTLAAVPAALAQSPAQRVTNGIVALVTDWGERDFYVGAPASCARARSRTLSTAGISSRPRRPTSPRGGQCRKWVPRSMTMCSWTSNRRGGRALGDDLIVIASTDLVEIAVNFGNAAERFGAGIGSPVRIEPAR